jgi:hypothetical protein
MVDKNVMASNWSAKDESNSYSTVFSLETPEEIYHKKI